MAEAIYESTTDEDLPPTSVPTLNFGINPASGTEVNLDALYAKPTKRHGRPGVAGGGAAPIAVTDLSVDSAPSSLGAKGGSEYAVVNDDEPEEGASAIYRGAVEPQFYAPFASTSLSNAEPVYEVTADAKIGSARAASNLVRVQGVLITPRMKRFYVCLLVLSLLMSAAAIAVSVFCLTQCLGKGDSSSSTGAAVTGASTSPTLNGSLVLSSLDELARNITDSDTRASLATASISTTVWQLSSAFYSYGSSVNHSLNLVADQAAVLTANTTMLSLSIAALAAEHLALAQTTSNATSNLSAQLSTRISQLGADFSSAGVAFDTLISQGAANSLRIDKMLSWATASAAVASSTVASLSSHVGTVNASVSSLLSEQIVLARRMDSASSQTIGVQSNISFIFSSLVDLRNATGVNVSLLGAAIVETQRYARNVSTATQSAADALSTSLSTFVGSLAAAQNLLEQGTKSLQEQVSSVAIGASSSLTALSSAAKLLNATVRAQEAALIAVQHNLTALNNRSVW
jgi:hypothetical protein